LPVLFPHVVDVVDHTLDTNGLSHVDIEVDGGIKIDNARDAVNAGASILVSGSGIVHGDIAANIKAMRSALA